MIELHPVGSWRRLVGSLLEDIHSHTPNKISKDLRRCEVDPSAVGLFYPAPGAARSATRVLDAASKARFEWVRAGARLLVPSKEIIMLATSFDLLMSSGFLCFSSHAGFLRALEATGERPTAFVGTSSGSLAAAFSAAGLSAEEVKQELGGQRPISLVRPSSRPWIGPISSRGLVKKLRTVLPDTFEELETPLAVGVYATARGSKEKIPMLVTSGSLPEAVAASCAVPGLFRPLHLVGSGGVAIGADGTVSALPSPDTLPPLLRSYADGGAVDRTMHSAWSHWRPGRSALVHLVSALPDGEFGPRDGLPQPSDEAAAARGVLSVVRTPRAKASFFSLKDYDAQVDAAAAAAERQLDALLALRGGGWASPGRGPEKRSTRREALIQTTTAAAATTATTAVAAIAAAAASPTAASLAATASAAAASAAPPIAVQLTLPDDFVRVSRSGRPGSNFLLVSGNFRTGSTLTVETVGPAQLRPSAKVQPIPATAYRAPLDAAGAGALAAALVRYRDASSGLDATSMPAEGVSLGGGGARLQFEFDTPLVFPPRPEDKELSRRTLVNVILVGADGESDGERDGEPDGERDGERAPTMVVLWAGAKRSEWDAGLGDAFRKAAASFDIGRV